MRAIRCSLRSMTRRPWSRAPWRTGSSSTSGCRASARRSSLPSEMFERLFVPEELREGFSDGAWLQAMLDVERALAAAEARAGLIPEDAARAIAEACRADRFDPAAIGEAARSPGNPVEPLVRAVREVVGGDAAQYVHHNATSQDILDTASMLVARRAVGMILESLEGLCGECARLAEAHRATPMIGRTLLQQALPTTFGLKAAGWLLGVLEARELLLRIREERLAVQLGGPAGTTGSQLAKLLSEELGLAEPVAPWHTNRVRIAELGCALGIAAGAAAKIGLDIGLLSQNEVDEVSEAEAARRPRCPTSAIRSGAFSPSPARGRRRRRRASSSGRWCRSTSGPSALGTRSGRRWSAHSAMRAAPPMLRSAR